MSAWLVIRADGKRWDSPISPPTHTGGAGLSGDGATGCTFLHQHARTSEWECVCMCTVDYHTSIPQRCLLISRNFFWHFSYSSAEVTVSSSVISHTPHLLLTDLIPPIFPLESACFFLSSSLTLHLLKFDFELCVNSTDVAPLFVFSNLTHYFPDVLAATVSIRKVFVLEC